MDETRTAGELAYERYGKVTNGLTHDGSPLLAWEQLPDRIKLAWEAAGTLPPELRNLSSQEIYGLCREPGPGGEMCNALAGHTPAGQHSWSPLPGEEGGE